MDRPSHRLRKSIAQCEDSTVRAKGYLKTRAIGGAFAMWVSDSNTSQAPLMPLKLDVLRDQASRCDAARKLVGRVFSPRLHFERNFAENWLSAAFQVRTIEESF